MAVTRWKSDILVAVLSYTLLVLGDTYHSAWLAFEQANLYIADGLSTRIVKVDVAHPPSLSFSSLSVGAVSSAQDVAVTNIGNAPLGITQISTSSNFALQGPNTTCASNGQSLIVGASCTLGIESAPSLAGSNSGNVVLTDDALNQPNATQPIALSATGSTVTFYDGSTQRLGAHVIKANYAEWVCRL